MKYKYLLIFLVIALCCISINIYKKFASYYTPAKERPYYKTAKHHEDTVRIAFIGDSWAQGHNNHRCIIAKTIDNVLNRPVLVASYGIGSLTSKEIYHALFEVEGLTRFMKIGYNYCVISPVLHQLHNSINCLITVQPFLPLA